MSAAALALAAELLTGGLLVCSEAHTLPHPYRVAVASTVAARMAETGWAAVKVMRAPRAYAPHLCRTSALEPGHVRAYIVGRWVLGPEWTRRAYAFHRLHLRERLEATWRRRGLEPYHVGPAHLWWRRR